MLIAPDFKLLDYYLPLRAFLVADGIDHIHTGNKIGNYADIIAGSFITAGSARHVGNIHGRQGNIGCGTYSYHSRRIEYVYAA